MLDHPLCSFLRFSFHVACCFVFLVACFLFPVAFPYFLFPVARFTLLLSSVGSRAWPPQGPRAPGEVGLAKGLGRESAPLALIASMCRLSWSTGKLPKNQVFFASLQNVKNRRFDRLWAASGRILVPKSSILTSFWRRIFDIFSSIDFALIFEHFYVIFRKT